MVAYDLILFRMQSNGFLLVGNYYHILYHPLYQNCETGGAHPTDYSHQHRSFAHSGDGRLQVQQELQAQQESTETHFDEVQGDNIPERELKDYLLHHGGGGKQMNCMADCDGFVQRQEVADVQGPDRLL